MSMVLHSKFCHKGNLFPYPSNLWADEKSLKISEYELFSDKWSNKEV